MDRDSLHNQTVESEERVGRSMAFHFALNAISGQIWLHLSLQFTTEDCIASQQD
jgi:hypothetical protein